MEFQVVQFIFLLGLEIKGYCQLQHGIILQPHKAIIFIPSSLLPTNTLVNSVRKQIISVKNKVLSKPISKKKIRRGRGLKFKSTKNIQCFKILGNNISSMNGKKTSFNLIVNQIVPSCVMVQETKLYKKGQVKIENYEVFENIRKYGEGGGLLTLIHRNFNPVQIPLSIDCKMSENVLVTEADIGNKRVRYINAYGPQENALITEKADFISILDLEIQNAQDLGHFICIQMDGNAKFGDQVIRGDPHPMSNNGKLLFDLLK